ncbi:MAG: pirin family protein [Betaproteobacteria bacterium]|nr:pirin family protein [Betaproteobacteria bacterium]
MDNTSVPGETVHRPRAVERLVAGEDTLEGAGVRLTRIFAQPLQHRLDPFLLLDAFGSNDPKDYVAGFPDHPHRGFETITYMVAGRMRHRDSAGHEGVLESGGVQWMTAGKGVIHSEMPEQEHGLLQGFQLWLNLPARDKLCAPWYRDFAATDLPRFTTDAKVAVTVIAGITHGIVGAVTRDATAPLYLDLSLPADGVFHQRLAPDYNLFVYVYAGRLRMAGTLIAAGQMAVATNEPDTDGLILGAMEGSRALLVGGRPLHEPVVQYGPFVMNSQQEIEQAIIDFQHGDLA